VKTHYVYVMANDARTTYISVTNDPERRVCEHRARRMPSSFSAQYGLVKLACAEDLTDNGDAIAREKQLKNWRRSKKVALINKRNPAWNDLAVEWDE